MSCSCGHDHSTTARHGRPAPGLGQIALSGHIYCANADELKIVLDHLPEHVALSRAEPGCLYFAIDQTADPMVWQIEELFADEAALDAHKARMNTSTWNKVSAALKRDIHRTDG